MKIKELLSTWKADPGASIAIVDLDKKEVLNLSKQMSMKKFGEYQVKSWYPSDYDCITIWIHTKKIKV